MNENEQEEIRGENEGKCCDMKVLTLALHFYTNMVASGTDYAMKLLRETSILHIFQFILANNIG